MIVVEDTSFLKHKKAQVTKEKVDKFGYLVNLA